MAIDSAKKSIHLLAPGFIAIFSFVPVGFPFGRKKLMISAGMNQLIIDGIIR